MPGLPYRRVYDMNAVEARRRLIETYEETGSLSETARQWQTSRHVARRSVRRHRQAGDEGLEPPFGHADGPNSPRQSSISLFAPN